MQNFELAILDAIQAHLRCGFLDAVLPAVSWTCNHGELWILLAVVLVSSARPAARAGAWDVPWCWTSSAAI